MTNHTLKTVAAIAALSYAGIVALEVAIVDKIVRGKINAVETYLANDQTNH